MTDFAGGAVPSGNFTDYWIFSFMYWQFLYGICAMWQQFKSMIDALLGQDDWFDHYYDHMSDVCYLDLVNNWN